MSAWLTHSVGSADIGDTMGATRLRTLKGRQRDMSDSTPGHGGEVTFTVHDEDDGETGTFSIKRGSSLLDAIAEAYKAVKRTPKPEDQINGEGSDISIAAGAHTTVAEYLAHGGVLVWLIAGPTGGARS